MRAAGHKKKTKTKRSGCQRGFLFHFKKKKTFFVLFSCSRVASGSLMMMNGGVEKNNIHHRDALSRLFPRLTAGERPTTMGGGDDDVNNEMALGEHVWRLMVAAISVNPTSEGVRWWGGDLMPSTPPALPPDATLPPPHRPRGAAQQSPSPSPQVPSPWKRSAGGLGEKWEDKVERVRTSSPYGDVPGWSLKPVIINQGWG